MHNAVFPYITIYDICLEMIPLELNLICQIHLLSFFLANRTRFGLNDHVIARRRLIRITCLGLAFPFYLLLVVEVRVST